MDRLAAVWARVSSSGQAETSLPDQTHEVKTMLEKLGYVVPESRILAVEWASLQLDKCPQFNTLKGWVFNQEVLAVGVYHRDRLEATPVQRVLFIKLCREKGVQLLACQGPVIEGDKTGDLLAFVEAWAKEEAVQRNQLNAKFGMQRKAKQRGLPTSKHRVFGYKWDGNKRLVPDENWKTVKLILDLVLKGMSYRQVAKELAKHHILSPKGNEWQPSNISSTIVRNPIYGGRYYALGKEVCEPKKRLGDTYGNSSARSLPLDQRVYLEEVEVEKPPITWEQFLQIQERVRKNQELAKRNAKHDYLLRGFIFCDTHSGKNGKPRHFSGKPNGSKWIYSCPISGCAHPNLDGPDIEEEVKARTKFLISMPPDIFYEHIGNRQSRDELQLSLRGEMDNLDAKYNKNISAETELAGLRIRGKISDEAYDRERRLLMAEQNWIDERKGDITEELDKSNRQAEAMATLDQIKTTLRDGFASLTNDQWRELFKTLNLEVHIPDKEAPQEIWRGQPVKGYWWADVRFGISIMPIKEVTDIVFTRACTSNLNTPLP
jgi:DNA invertase Pin-like site-specific DNA recombinase